MNARLIQFLRNLRGSYWFLPGAMVLGAIALSIVTLWLDAQYAEPLSSKAGWLFTARSDGARAMLSTIAASMLGIAGVTFSMTLVSVSFAAANYGPRLIGNFMRDRGNQVVLGTFIATFVYALLILRRVRAGGDDLSSFVPQLSVVVAVLLTLLSVSVLIYFIHHVPETINVSRLTASIGRTLARNIESTFPAENREGHEQGTRQEPAFDEDDARELASTQSGYLQTLNEERLLEISTKHEVVVRLRLRPGEFAVEGDQLLLAGPAERWTDELECALESCFAFGSERTPAQDLLFLADQLVEILGRALSPGVNDPYTAMDCIHWMQCALCSAVCLGPCEAEHFDEQGAPRLIVCPVTFELLLQRLLTHSIQYVAADRNAALTFLAMLEVVALRATSSDRRAQVLEGATQLAAACEVGLGNPVLQAEVVTRLERLEARLRAEPT